ncbi:hypothetical protein N5J77_05870 [Sphingobium yanoikuyae]|jgi:hypothetical protein|uniref:Uncharacterized protein n=1 Tax=Sphingobium yanoikuyae TaxID=13690 RepID=A0AA42WRU2_SPHYA|nr:hypothetical protein [Sphingobium yanoikuyae]MBV2150392.1 hypothetical protein [Sphingobium sp. AS12]QWT15709.1 hypothetical protein GTV57_00450 [Sphingobium xenophagum]MDH2130644.1 hypothetical protein [Sphingobium yanoikuyae]MDH2150991.1 hypothetical protein [Sphingobium yanoikuyae]MDH2166159.1 hypothetical protein [Sphingobium yanoikuyae]|tara:strand:+ start:3395 stop:3835 length:441 start_codon:yes stop_codon:yes gene_type:complete
MTRQVLFLAFLLLSSAFAFRRGDQPEKIGAVTLLLGASLTVLVASPLGTRFQNVEAGILVIDISILGIFLWLSIQSTRFWPIWIAAILGAEVVVHVALAIAPEVVPRAYMHGLALWGWFAQLALVIATWRHRRRLKRLGADAPWKS